ncbi:hypothetical protein [Chondromyces crocatus]|uniref:Uncharacterized protein n=1 Tax=Chondromyces crocatus TaxID=52 RepID=A0A0K1E935_CHOCO|nr:hypothetical protein [Chondromyces crocatus]AKT37073.1 uncharacterized protein CMC5_011990 [Chondromyces crocatus]
MGRWLHALSTATTALFLSLGQAGCAGHESRVQNALAALNEGKPAQAAAHLNEEMKVGSNDELPQLTGDNPLLLLDRGNILLAMDRNKLSARDLGAADKSIDMLDMSRTAVDEIGKYIFSDDSGPYRAPPHEKLLINTINLMNYLALGDLSGAKVEARRLAIMQKYLRDHEETTALIGLGSYLAGFAFEKSGGASEALLYYDDALRYAQYPSLRDPLRTLVRDEPKSPGIKALIGGAGPLPSVAETGEAELLVVVGFGRSPRKVPNRIPIGLALTILANDISPADRAQANALAAKGLVTWVNYPTLTAARGSYTIPTFSLDGAPVRMEQAIDIEAEVRKAWRKVEGTVILSALTRTITRVVAGEVVQGVTQAVDKDSGPLGLLLGLLTSATLTVADTPDTRAWSTLPAQIAISRIRVPAGQHELVLSARNVTKRARLNLRPGGWAFVPMMALR